MISQSELRQRLTLAATPPVALSATTRAGQQRLITSLLAEAQASPVPRSSRHRRAAVAALAAILSIAGPGLVAVAQQALPGEALYGLKRESEKVLAIFDVDIRARHRIAELEELVNTDQDLTGSLAEAEAELEGVEDEELLTRWAVIVGVVGDDEAERENSEEEHAEGDTATSVAPADDDDASGGIDGDESTGTGEDQSDAEHDDEEDSEDDAGGSHDDSEDDDEEDSEDDAGGSHDDSEDDDEEER